MSLNLSRILVAPLSVKVRQSMLDGKVSVFLSIWAALMLRSSVLPVPGPAMTSRGPKIVSTASFWFEFKLLKRFSNVILTTIAESSLVF